MSSKVGPILFKNILLQIVDVFPYVKASLNKLIKQVKLFKKVQKLFLFDFLVEYTYCAPVIERQKILQIYGISENQETGGGDCLYIAADRVCYGLFWLEFKLLMRQRVEMAPARLIFRIGRLDLLYLFKGNLLNSTSGLFLSCQLSKIEKMLISLTFPLRF